MRNDGDVAWPADTTFIQTNGDDMGAKAKKVGSVGANTSTEIFVDFVAPTLPGHYKSYFRVMTDEKYRFGHKVWCDVVVQERPEEVKIDAPVDPVKLVA